MNTHQHRSLLYIPFATLLACASSLADAADGGRNAYSQTNLVSNQAGVAATTDANLTNAWGIAFNPYGVVWVADNASSFSTLYDGQGAKAPLEVAVPGKKPTGIVYFGGTNGFSVDGNPSRFIFSTENGTIDAWTPALGGSASTVATSTTGAIYKGLALIGNGTALHLYATDFHNGTIAVFDADFHPATLSCTFSDPKLPGGFAPFGIQALNGNLYVTYAMQDADREDDVKGPGLGFVNVFDPNGCLIGRVARRGKLNAPWGLAIALANFGKFSNTLLVGNFGDGRINAFDPTTHQFRGQLRTGNGEILAVDGLWALAFGNGVSFQPTNSLFFSAGPHDEADGLYGKIEAMSP